jgi:hypothetical protein
MAAAAFATGDRARGERLLEEARALGLEDAAGALVRGLARLSAGDEEGASRAFERAIALGTTATVPRAAYIEATVARLAALDAALMRGAAGAGERGPRASRPDLSEAEELAVIAAERFPDVAELAHATALCALRRGDEARALERARRAAALDRGDGAAVRLARLLLVRAGRFEEAYETWLAGLPAARAFSPENEELPRLEALRDAVQTPGDRAALARAFAACGWADEALALAPDEPRARLARSARAALARLPRDASVADALAALAGATGLPPLEPRDGEAGTLATPEAPLVRALLDAGTALDIRPTREGLVARALAVVASRRVALPGGRAGRALVCEGAGAGLAPRGSLLGRTCPLGTGFLVDLDAIRPAAAEVRALTGALRDRAAEAPRGPEATAPAGTEDAIATSAALRADLVRRAAPLLGDPGDEFGRLFAALTDARLRYVCEHETGHLVDLARLVPVSSHPIANVGRVIDGGLAPDDVAARYEEIAELYALAGDPVPYVPLLSMARALPEIDRGAAPAAAPDPESAAAARAASQAVFRTLRDGARDLLQDPRAPLARAVAALDPVAIRKIARRRLAAAGIEVAGPP